MRNTRACLTLLLLVLLSTEVAAADENLSYGIGLGTMYSGLGMNIGITSESDYRYIDAGCISANRSSVACGVGVGWIWSNILTNANNNHGLGVFLGPVTAKLRHSNDSLETIYGVGFGYVYFFNGINGGGLNLGIFSNIGRVNGETKVHFPFQIGYQF